MSAAANNHAQAQQPLANPDAELDSGASYFSDSEGDDPSSAPANTKSPSDLLSGVYRGFKKLGSARDDPVKQQQQAQQAQQSQQPQQSLFPAPPRHQNHLQNSHHHTNPNLTISTPSASGIASLSDRSSVSPARTCSSSRRCESGCGMRPRSGWSET